MVNVTEMTLARIAARIMLYIGLAIGGILVLALALYVSVQENLHIPKKWIALTFFTGVLLFAIMKVYRPYWGRLGFWLLSVGILLVHLAIFIPLLMSYPEFRPAWYVPAVTAEVVAVGAIFGALLDGPHKDSRRARDRSSSFK